MAGWSYFGIPRKPRISGLTTDYEVVELKSTTGDGHRLVTLRLRTSPKVKGPTDRIIRSCSTRMTCSWSAPARGGGRRDVRGPVRLRPSGRTADFPGPHRDKRRFNPAEGVDTPGGHGVPLRPDSRVGVRPSTVPGQPASRARSPGSRSKSPRCGGGPRMVLAGVRRRRNQPGNWVRPCTAKSLPSDPAGGLKPKRRQASPGAPFGSRTGEVRPKREDRCSIQR